MIMDMVSVLCDVYKAEHPHASPRTIVINRYLMDRFKAEFKNMARVETADTINTFMGMTIEETSMAGIQVQ